MRMCLELASSCTHIGCKTDWGCAVWRLWLPICLMAASLWKLLHGFSYPLWACIYHAVWSCIHIFNCIWNYKVLLIRFLHTFLHLLKEAGDGYISRETCPSYWNISLHIKLWSSVDFIIINIVAWPHWGSLTSYDCFLMNIFVMLELVLQEGIWI